MSVCWMRTKKNLQRINNDYWSHMNDMNGNLQRKKPICNRDKFQVINDLKVLLSDWDWTGNPIADLLKIYGIDAIYTNPWSLNRMSSLIVRLVAASGLAQEFWIVLPAKFKIKNSMSSVYSRLYGTYYTISEKLLR